VLGLQREAELGVEERDTLEQIAALVTDGARAEARVSDLECENAALRALGAGTGTDFLLERGTQKIAWASRPLDPVDWTEEIAPIESALRTAVDDFCAAQERGDVLPTPPRFEFGVLAAAADVQGGTPVGVHCTALRLRSYAERSPTGQRLSAREREVARLIVHGFASANIAARTGLSEPTVRTYIRRIYRKLDVCNRADLVRKILTPDR
jgi:DNA-binding CsgD family transcriptional regulator